MTTSSTPLTGAQTLATAPVPSTGALMSGQPIQNLAAGNAAPPATGSATPPNPFAATGTQATVNPASAAIPDVGSTQAQAPPVNPGLLANAMGTTSNVNFNNAPVTNATAATSTAATANPAAANVAAQETVPGMTNTSADVNSQLGSVLAANSPVLQAAQTAADQASQSRGLLNSSMAVQSGEGAVINAALPIAQQNASTNAAAATLNTQNTQQSGLTNTANTQQAQMQTAGQEQQTAITNAANTQQTNLTNAQAQNTGAQFNSQGQLTASQQNSSALNANVATQLNNSLQTALQGANASEQSTLQNANSQTQLSLGNIQSTYQTLISSNAQAASMWNTVQGNLNSIMLNPNLDAAAKTSAMQTQIGYLQNGMNTMAAITGLNLGSIISPSTAQVTGGGAAPAAGAVGGAATPAPAASALPPAVPAGSTSVGAGYYKTPSGQTVNAQGQPLTI